MVSAVLAKGRNVSDDTVPFGSEDVSRDEKMRRVRGVFSSVASRYDVMNDLMSAGVHRVWKANMIARLNPQPGETLIDVASGTGDVARAFLKRAAAVAARRGTGDQTFAYMTDINADMLAEADVGDGDNTARIVCDAAHLPFPDGTADAITISFGIRNVADIEGALAEFGRVLKPGGRFACLEFSQMTHSLLQDAYDRYSYNVIPRMGELVTGDRDSYQYLVESIRRFPRQDVFADMIRAAGFARVSHTNYTGGVATLHTGWAV